MGEVLDGRGWAQKSEAFKTAVGWVQTELGDVSIF